MLHISEVLPQIHQKKQTPLTQDDRYQINKAIDGRAAFKRLKNMITAYNVDKPLNEQLRNGFAHTIEWILRLYLKQLRKGLEVDPCFLSDGKLPVFRTNNKALARVVCGSQKTIYNRIQRLKNAGIILSSQNKAHHGITLELNPNLFGLIRKNLPPLVLVQKENKNKAVVDNSCDIERSRLSAAQDELYEPSTRDLHKAKSSYSTNKTQKIKANKGGGAQKITNQPQNLTVSPEYQAYQREVVDDFWKYAKGLLWYDKNFDPARERKIKILIFKNHYGGVFRGKFKQKPSKKLVNQYQQKLKNLIDVAFGYINAKQGRYALDPEIYFNRNTKKGAFHNVNQWLEKAHQKRLQEHQYRKVIAKRNSVINGVKKDFEAFFKGVKFETKTYYEVYMILEKRIKTYNDTLLNQMFQQVVNQNIQYHKIVH